MRPFLLISVLLLAACDAPSAHFAAVPATRIAVNGSLFEVRVRGHLAEAIRVSPEYAPRFGPIRYRAGLAMALVSGCSVRRVLGDQAQAVGWLDCPGRAAPAVRVDRACRRVAAGEAGYTAYRCLSAQSAARRRFPA